MNELRQEILDLLDRVECQRPAMIRRSLYEEYLYATDLPQAAASEAVDIFRIEAELAGWRTKEINGWIQLDRIPEKKPVQMSSAEYRTEEAQCCKSLLTRHPGQKNGDREKRLLLKGNEAGKDAIEKTCRLFHQEWAAALRKGEALPDIAEYFQEE